MPDLVTNPDATRLAALDARCFAERWDVSAYALLRANPAVRAWLLRDEAGAEVGLLCGQRVADEAELYRIAVVPQRRREGLARWLLLRYLDECGAAGLSQVHLEVRAGNAAARGLYEQSGFRETGRRPGYYRDPPEDAVLYRWPAEAEGAKQSQE